MPSGMSGASRRGRKRKAAAAAAAPSHSRVCAASVPPSSSWAARHTGMSANVSERIWTPSRSPRRTSSSSASGISAATAAMTRGRGRPRAIQTTSAMKSSGASGKRYRSSIRSEKRDANAATWIVISTTAAVTTARNARSAPVVGVRPTSADPSSTRNAQAGTMPTENVSSAACRTTQCTTVPKS